MPTEAEKPLLSPPETTVPICPIDGLAPEVYEDMFGRLHNFRDRFFGRWYFGRQARDERRQRVRHYGLVTWDRISSPLKLIVREVQRRKNKQTGAEETVLHDSLARLGLEDLRVLLGPRLMAELLEDHRDSIIGVALQLMTQDAADYEEWMAKRGGARPAPRKPITHPELPSAPAAVSGAPADVAEP